MLKLPISQLPKLQAIVAGQQTESDMVDWLVAVGDKNGGKAQCATINSLYLLAQQNGMYVGGTATLGNSISVQQNHSLHVLSRKQVEAVVRDVFNWRVAR